MFWFLVERMRSFLIWTAEQCNFRGIPAKIYSSMHCTYHITPHHTHTQTHKNADTHLVNRLNALGDGTASHLNGWWWMRNIISFSIHTRTFCMHRNWERFIRSIPYTHTHTFSFIWLINFITVYNLWCGECRYRFSNLNVCMWPTM